MSYILDALKKLEKERKKGNVPGILTVRELKVKEKKKLTIWPYLLIAALFLNASLFIWWISWEKGKTKVIHKENSGLSAKSDIGSVIEKIEDKKSEPLPVKKEKKSDGFNSESVFSKYNLEEGTAFTKAKPKKLFATSTNVEDKGSTDVINPSNEDVISLPIKDKIYNLEELPLQIKQKLPDLKVTISLYSDDPTSRVAQINNVMLREGQYLAEGLKLEEITPKDIILNYRNYRFRVSLH